MEEKFNHVLSAVALNSDILTCPDEWLRVVDSCIWISNDGMTFDKAAEKCKELNNDARLYEPSSKYHNDIVANILQEQNRRVSHWIGIHDKVEENS